MAGRGLGLVQSLKVRLLAMLHLGFLWLSLSLLLSGASQLLGMRTGAPAAGPGGHARDDDGFLGSLLLAMVTRVSSATAAARWWPTTGVGRVLPAKWRCWCALPRRFRTCPAGVRHSPPACWALLMALWAGGCWSGTASHGPTDGQTDHVPPTSSERT